MIEVANSRMALLFDEKNGALRKITDRQRNLVLAENTGDEAFLLECGQGEYTSSYQDFSYASEETQTVLRWTLEKGIILTAHIGVEAEEISFRAQVANETEKMLCSLEYPLLDGIKSLAGDGDFVAHPYATGFLVRNPTESFAAQEEGFRYMPYPESFSGASMQFFVYYSENLGGLYFAAYDGEYRQKWLNFYKKYGALRASHIFGYEDVGPGKPLVMDWKFVLRTLAGQDWYEGCDLYREWAHRQEWCGKGKRLDMPESEKAGWLFDDTGAATFGINGMHDRTRWLRKYHRAVGTPIFHVTGPDWPKERQGYGGGLPGGYDDWFPTRFSKENIHAARENGDHFAPFEFDFLLSPDKSDVESIQRSLQVWPEKPKSCDPYTFHMLCPATDYTKHFHVERDRRVIRESGADSMYYDISANNILKTCMSDTHGHTVGAGSELIRAYRSIYRETKKALSEEKGGYVPLGTEMINETFIDVLDYYQARANAQPCSALETWPYRKLLLQNKAFVIPMFQYVYSEYAPLRLDGWGKLVREGGSLIYHTIAKTYLWGGLFEINSEYSPMEVVDDAGENPSKEHYCDFQPRGYRFDDGIAAYLSRFAALRVGEPGAFLQYGEMLRPSKVTCRSVDRTYFHYNIGKAAGEYESGGVIPRESIVAAKYRLRDETALFFTNTTAEPENAAIQDSFIKSEKMYQILRNRKDGTIKTDLVSGSELGALAFEPLEIIVIRKTET